MPYQQDLLDEGPREAPAALTADDRLAAPRRTIIGGSVVGFAVVLGLNLLGLIRGYGPMFSFLALIVGFGLTVNRLVRRAARQGANGSPLRGLVLVFAAITVAAFVLVILSGFQPNDWIVVAVPAAATAVLGVADRLLMRQLASPPNVRLG